MSYLFLFKNYEEDDRDCVVYVQDEKNHFHCDHYFGSVILHGSCFSGRDFPDYDDIKTILTEQEYQLLINLNKQLDDLGYGIKKDDERYIKGVELWGQIEKIFDKLKTEENQKLFEEIQQEEIDYLIDMYGFSEDEVKEIFDRYYLDYRDRSIVGMTFDSVYDLGYEEFYGCGFGNDSFKNVESFFDFEAFGEAILSDDNYIQLKDGKIVSLNY